MDNPGPAVCRSNRVRVALAEDDDEQRDALQRALELEGFEVVTFEDGSELVDYFSLTGLRIRWPDVVITDVGMPGSSGLDAIELARSRGAQVPVFIVTGNADPEIRARTARMGNALLFLKPIHIDRLAQAIWQLVRVQQIGTDAEQDKLPPG